MMKPNVEDAINYMCEAKDVQDWNNRREHIKKYVDQKDVAEHIDASGLIVKVLGVDDITQYE
jgi:hypothetical protein